MTLGTATHCPYCALQCGMRLVASGRDLTVTGNPAFPVNAGGLCVKGWSATATLNHPDRLLTPLVRSDGGTLVPAGWDAALERVAGRIEQIQKQYGRDSIGVFGGGSLTNEKAYLLGKFARIALGTPNIDYNGRFCMSSAAAAASMAFGLDRGLPFPLEDIPHAKTILLAGGNVAETMPPIMRYFEAQQASGGVLIVVDPRQSVTARRSTRHLQLKPGTDVALANGLLHVLIRDRLIDRRYIRERTEGFDSVRHRVARYWPDEVERLTGVPETLLVEAAHMLGGAETAMILTARGPEQQAQGVTNTLAYINIALALGKVGQPFSGYGTLTGQGNGQGGREHGQKADQLPGYRKIDDPAARDHVAKVWNVPASTIPGAGKSAYELLDSAGAEGGIRALVVVGSNLAVSAPDARRTEERLRSLDLLVVADFFVSETAELAHVVFPTAQWAEEEGTVTNLEGRVIRRRRAIPPPEGVWTDLELLSALGRRLGQPEQFARADSGYVFEELCRASQGGPADYSGISYHRIDTEEGLFWPCPATDHRGSPRLFSEAFPTPTGRARFHAVSHQQPADARDDEFPLYLTTGRAMAHYQSGTQTRRVAALRELMPEAVAEMHPLSARLAGVAEGERVTLVTRRGSATFRLRLTRTIREDTVFAPFHWPGDQSANRLTNAALDPISKMPEFKRCAVRVEACRKTGREEKGE